MSGPVQPPQDVAVYVGGSLGVTAGATAGHWLPLINSALGLVLLLLSIVAMALTIVSRWRNRKAPEK